MIYRPARERMWDTWIYGHGGVYYLFYIRISPGGQRWDGVSLARSTDLLHWEEVGPVLEKHADALWLGTGMVVRVDDRFIMNFSEERPAKHQVIGFAESNDLQSWRRLATELRPDPRWYEAEPEDSAEPVPRWDSLGVVEVPGRAGGRFLATICANTRSGPRGGSGVLGLAESDDAVHWRCLPPASESMRIPNYEVPEYVRFGDRWYVLFATNSPAANRFDPLAGNSGGTYYVVSDRPEGPFVAPPGDGLLQGTRAEQWWWMNTYVGRPLRVGDEWLYYHHWSSRHDSPNAWVGPPKRLVERGPWQLGLDYWDGCEQLKGPLLARGAEAVQVQADPPIGMRPLMTWATCDGDVVAKHEGGSGCLAWKVAGDAPASTEAFTDLRDGVILETTVRLDSGRGLGVWIGTRKANDRFAVNLSVERGKVEFLVVTPGHGPSPMLLGQQAVPWPLAAGVSHRLRLLARREFIEVYIDDRYVQGHVVGEGFDVSRLGFFSELGNGVFGQPTVWGMR